ncbi:MAG: hypothetical protein K5762_04060 [Bacilli bacterium]|nr:hypothetical protein [Bacilli bacterium]
MIGYWISFSVIFIAIPFGIYEIRRWAIKGRLISSDQIKSDRLKPIFLTVFYWLCDLFYMSVFIENLICQYIFGGIVMLIIFVNLAKAFTYSKEKSGVEIFGILQDFVIGVGLTIYLIYLIPNQTVQSIVIPLVSAIYGGMITLVGVAWTIKKSDLDKKREEMNKVRPFLFFVAPKNIKEEPSNIRYLDELIYYVDAFSGKKRYSIDNFYLKNTDYSYSSIKGLCINDDLMIMSIAQVLDKNEVYLYKRSAENEFFYAEEIKKIYLLIEDVFENYYLYETNFKIKNEADNFNLIELLSGIELIPVDVDLDNLEIKLKTLNL